jgi:hypothetical protein
MVGNGRPQPSHGGQWPATVAHCLAEPAAGRPCLPTPGLGWLPATALRPLALYLVKIQSSELDCRLEMILISLLKIQRSELHGTATYRSRISLNTSPTITMLIEMQHMFCIQHHLSAI